MREANTFSVKAKLIIPSHFYNTMAGKMLPSIGSKNEDSSRSINQSFCVDYSPKRLEH